MNDIGYLTGTYPRATDTFIQREILSHRAAGWHVATFAVRPPHDEHLMSDAQRQERASTDYLLEDAWRLIRDVGSALVRWPNRIPGTLMLAWRTRRRGVLGTMLQAVYFAEAAALARRLQRRGIRHLHNHLGDSSCTVAMLSAHLGDHDFSFTLHGPGIFYEAVTWQVGEKVRRAAFCACISYYARAQAAVFAPDRLEHLEIIRCGIEPHLYSLRSHDEGGNVVVSVARLDTVKGLGLLIQATSQLIDAGIDMDLVLIGDGPDRKELAHLVDALGISAHVHFLGYRSPTEVARRLAVSDVFALPSFAEGVPVSLMEAMASGLPVVATNVGGVSELVDDGTNGYLIPPGSAEILASRIELLLKSRELRESMGRAGREKVARVHNSAREAEKLRAAVIRHHAVQ